MKTIGNVLWLIFGGLLQGFAFFFMGVVWCLTLIGIPLGVAFLRIGLLSLLPFGKEISVDFEAHPVGNIIWLVLGGAGMAGTFAVLGVILCLTIIGIPFGIQCFKLMKLSALPYGAEGY